MVGLIGSVIPIIPGHLIILVAAIAHRLMMGPDSGIRWWSFLVLALLLIISQLLEFLSGAAGAKVFGGSKWGALGALLGGIVGIFFFPFGLVLGPLFGAILFEKYYAKKENQPALVSGVGSVVGTLTGMAIKLVFGILMIVWFVLDVTEVV